MARHGRWVYLAVKNMDETGAKAQRAWAFAQEKISSRAYDLIILDEITYTFNHSWLDVHEVIAWLKVNKPKELYLIIMGRAAPPELIDYADLVTKMRDQASVHTRDQGASWN